MSYQTELIQCAAVCLAAIHNYQKGDTSLEDNGDGLLGQLLLEVAEERRKQERKWGSRDRSPEKWMVILMEEVGEAAKDVLENNYA